MRLAYFSPLPPVSSGISDYSAELLPYLAGYAEIELFVADPALYSNPFPLSVAGPSANSPSALPLHSYRAFPSRASNFDFPIYHMGNSPGHAFVYETSQRVPGVLVLHDLVLHHFFAWRTVDRRDTRGYIELMREAYGERGAELAEAEAKGLAALDRFAFPLCEPMVRQARAVIVHSDYAARAVGTTAPGKPLAVVPMGVPLPHAIPKAEARRRLGLGADEWIVAAFGEVHAHKRITVALEAFRKVHARRPSSRLVLVGHVSPNYDIENLIRFLGLADAVQVVGYAPREAYEDYIAAADVCLNLRYPTAGETSANVLRLLGAGRPVIVTRTGAYAELPSTVCLGVEPDAFECDLLVAEIEYLAEHPEFARALGENARRYVAEQHTLEGAARGYIEFLVRLRQGSGGAEGSTQKAVGSGATVGARHSQDQYALNKGFQTVPITQSPSHPITQPPGSLAEEAGEAAGALGLSPDDPLLREVARAVVEIGGKLK